MGLMPPKLVSPTLDVRALVKFSIRVGVDTFLKT